MYLMSSGPKLPKEIRKLAQKADDDAVKRGALYEDWITSGEDWKKSRLLQIIRSKDSLSKQGLRRWCTFQEMVARWGQQVAEDIRDHKMADERLRQTEVRSHPDCPKREAGTF